MRLLKILNIGACVIPVGIDCLEDLPHIRSGGPIALKERIEHERVVAGKAGVRTLETAHHVLAGGVAD